MKKIALILIVIFLFSALINSIWFLGIIYPYPYREIAETSSARYDVDPCLVAAIMRTESRFNRQAVSAAGARGLMQIMPETGQWIAQQMKIRDYSVELLLLPEFNLTMGIWYIAYLQRVFQDDLPIVLAAYNAGENKVKSWLASGIWTGLPEDVEQIPYAETRKYIGKVLFDYHIYTRVYGRGDR